MSKAKIHRDGEGRFYGILIRCPGCLYSNGRPQEHILPIVNPPAGEEVSPHISWKDRWGFNGDYDCPTFTPSLNTWWGGEGSGIPLHRCHSFITDGKIQFLGDCTHELVGQTVDLPELEE